MKWLGKIFLFESTINYLYDDPRFFRWSAISINSWIGGGMFAMSHVYVLHLLGLCTRHLDWSVEKLDARLKKYAESVILNALL